MTIALWIIAIVETIRMIEQTLQLRLIAKDTGARDNAYAEFIKSLKYTDREFVKRMLMEFEQTEPKTERIKTLDYCDICNHKGCDNCIANNLDDYCVPSGYEPTTQTETQNLNLTFEKDECAKEYEELGLKELKELINADRKTENSSEKPNNCEPQKWETPPKFEHKGLTTTCVSVPACLLEIVDEPQTERSSE